MKLTGVTGYLPIDRNRIYYKWLDHQTLNVAKCNLGKVKFKTMLVSGRPTLRLRGDLFGALCWGCLMACIAFACLLAGLCERSFCSLIFKPFSRYFRLLYYQARFFRCDVISSDEQQSFCFPV